MASILRSISKNQRRKRPMLKESSTTQKVEMLNLEQRSDEELQDWILHYVDVIMQIEKELEKRGAING